MAKGNSNSGGGLGAGLRNQFSAPMQQATTAGMGSIGPSQNMIGKQITGPLMGMINPNPDGNIGGIGNNGNTGVLGPQQGGQYQVSPIELPQYFAGMNSNIGMGYDPSNIQQLLQQMLARQQNG